MPALIVTLLLAAGTGDGIRCVYRAFAVSQSLNRNTVELQFWQVTTIYQVPDRGSMGTGNLFLPGYQEIGAGGGP